jgi:nucleoside-diphosphate-sugar epimerase
MRVLLAGATGAIGRRLVPQLIAAGHSVIGITRTAGALAGTGATELVADVSRRASFLAALEGVKADAVIHELTALKKAPARYSDMRQTNRLRAEGASTLIAAAKRVGAKRFITASIFYGYGFHDHGSSVLDELAPFGEQDGSRNDSVQTALLSDEQQVRAFGGIALRYGIFYAPGARSIPPIPQRWMGSLPVVHIEDAAHATVLALEKGKSGEAYNIVDDSPTTWRELQSLQAAADGLRPPVELPELALRVVAPFGAQLMTRTSMILSNAKAKRDLGWSPKFASVAQGLPAAIALESSGAA